MWKKILAGILILVGLIFIFSNQINEQLIKYKARSLTQEVNEVTAEQMKENNEQRLPPELEKEIYDFSQVREASLEETWSSLFERAQEDQLFTRYLASIGNVGNPDQPDAETKPDGDELGDSVDEEPDRPGTDRPQAQGNATQAGTVSAPPTEEEAREALKSFTKSFYIGMLKIPRINLELGVLRGVRNNNLYVGAGPMRADQVMGASNYPIAGHHMRAWEVLFNRVPELKTGHLMYLTDKENIYTYRVYENRKVHESEVNVISDQVSVRQGSPVLTLVTCFHRNEPEARIIIHGELINTQPYSDAAFNNLG